MRLLLRYLRTLLRLRPGHAPRRTLPVLQPRIGPVPWRLRRLYYTQPSPN